jgi:hypothetical protein
MTDNDSDPRSADARDAVLRATTLRTLGDLDGALAILSGAAAQSFAHPQVAFSLAQMLAEVGLVDRADPWFRHALKLAPESWPMRQAYGWFLFQRGQVESACAVFETLRLAILRATAEGPYAELSERLERDHALGLASVSLACTCFDLGDTCRALELVSPWLAREDHWASAHRVFAAVATHDHLDLSRAAEAGLISGEVSPLMVCHLLEQAARAVPPRLPTLERVVTRANEHLRFEWQTASPELEQALVVARQALARAAMCGEARVADYPNLANATGIRVPPAPWDHTGSRHTLRVHLCGLVHEPSDGRPSHRNDGARCRQAPVFIGEMEAGFAVVHLERDAQSGHLTFEAYLDPALTPASWSGRHVPFLFAERGTGRRGRLFERIVVASDARPLPALRLVRFSDVEGS